MLHFILTSLSLPLLLNPLLPPLLPHPLGERHDHAGTRQMELRSGLRLVQFLDPDVPDNPQYTEKKKSRGSEDQNGPMKGFYQEGPLDVFCLTLGDSDLSTSPSLLASEYLAAQALQKSSSSGVKWIANSSHATCALIDHDEGVLYLVGDVVGAVPLWYEITNNPKEIYVTSQPLLIHPAFSQLTPVGAGHTLSIQLSGELFFLMNCYQVLDRAMIYKNTISTSRAHDIASELFEAAMDLVVIAMTNASSSTGIMTELDYNDDSGIFLDCVLHSVYLNNKVPARFSRRPRKRYYSQPLVYDSNDVPDILTSEIFDLIKIFERKYRQENAPAWEAKYYTDTFSILPNILCFCRITRVAISKAKMCQEAYANELAILSFDTGITGTSERALAIFFQNYFCSALGVEVFYPFAPILARMENFSAALLRRRFALDKYISESKCRDDITYDDSNSINILPHRPKAVQDIPPPINKSRRRDNVLVLKVNRTQQIGSDSNDPSIGLPSFTQMVVSVAKKHAFIHSQGQEIFLLLVTSSYLEIFMNFICHVKVLQDIPRQDMFMVLTPHSDVVKVAEGAGFGTIFVDSNKESISSVFNLHNLTEIGDNAGASFGTVLYQRLIYLRTITASILLEGGFNPVIADIDTVWFKYPLSLPRNPDDQINSTVEDFDIIVTYDEDEICGCFIYLNCTSSTKKFWKTLAEKHRQILLRDKNHNDDSSRRMDNFFDSEQKILTDLLLKRQYTPELGETLRVYTQPRGYFLNGRDYFMQSFTVMNAKIKELSPAVVHNNFVIGSSLKKIRFQRYGLWRVDIEDVDVDDGRSVLTSSYCVASSFPSSPLFDTRVTKKDQQTADAIMNTWVASGLFYSVSRNTSLRSLNIILPLHNEIIQHEHFLKMMVLVEGFSSQPGRVFSRRNPPSYFPFHSNFFVAEFSYDFLHAAFTVDVPSSGLVAYVDVIGSKNTKRSLSYDRQYHKEAIKKVRESSLWAKEWDAPSRDNDSDHLNSVSFRLSVLTYNRPSSLLRLLSSLAKADYGVETDVQLHISIDYPSEDASVEDIVNRRKSISVAKNFLWRFGTKSVEIHENHRGLKEQWKGSFQPLNSSTGMVDQNVITIVLEDDLEVSRYFFMWTINAVKRYYTKKQIRLHEDLLESVRQTTSQDPNQYLQCLKQSINEINDTSCGPIDSFVKSSAGLPLQYGICLSKQREDFYHYPYELEVRNGFRPFMYSPVGTWGTVLYPVIWQAFLEWWTWRESASSSPLIDLDVQTNFYYMQNPLIWSPWHIRFAYETGAKCLYSNFPGNLTLVSNHREKGLNYATSLGARTVLLDKIHLDQDEKIIHGDDLETSARLWSFPSYSTLVYQQYDMNLRRPGRKRFSIDSLLVSIEHENSTSRHLLSERHWDLVNGMIDKYLLNAISVFHIEPYFDPHYFDNLGLEKYDIDQGVRNVVLSSECSRWTSHFSYNTFRCVNLPQNLVSLSEVVIEENNVDIVVLNEPLARKNIGQNMRLVWKGMQSFDFSHLLVLGACNGAPTGVTLLENDVGDTCKQIDSFFMIESICSERQRHDIGAVLYQREKEGMNSGYADHDYYFESRRHNGELISRRLRKTFSFLND